MQCKNNTRILIAPKMDIKMEIKEEPLWESGSAEVNQPTQMPFRRKTWDPEVMKCAIAAVRSGKMGYLLASKKFGVPKGTLEKYVKHEKKTPEELMQMRSGRKPVLPNELENLLVKYCLQMDKRYFGLRTSDVKRMAFELAIQNGLQHPFNLESASAGKKWFKLFIARHPNLSLHTPQGVSTVGIKSFTAENVAAFFNIYEAELEKVNFNGHRVYNVDETGITVVQQNLQKVVTLKAKKQVSNLTSAERGALVTVVTCMNATGIFIPPLFIFPRKHMKLELMDGAPPGSISACHPSGWIQTDIFCRWFDHFIKFARPSKAEPVILVLDGHHSHTRNIEVIEKARNHHVSIVCLPPYSSAKMQPLDVSFMKALKGYYAQEISNWLHNFPGSVITHNQVVSLFGVAYHKAATLQISINGFRKAGLIPCNRNAFSASDFVVHTGDESDEIVIPTAENFIEPVDVSPLPQVPKVQEPEPSISREAAPRKGKARKASLITSSPYHQNLKKSLIRKEKGAACKKLFQKKKTAGERRRLQPKRCKGSTKISEIAIDFVDASDSDFEPDDADAECLFCTGLYSKDTRGRKWARCMTCHQWAHEECGGEEEPFMCTFCSQKSS